METPRSAQEFVEIFRTDSVVVAQELVDVLLIPEGIEALVHDRKDQAFPGVGQPGSFYIAVPAEQRTKAVGLIDEARENGMIDAEDGAKV
jgi:hypothetical protein